MVRINNYVINVYRYVVGGVNRYVVGGVNLMKTVFRAKQIYILL